MIRAFAISTCLVLASPSLAQEDTQGRGLIERGAEMLLEGLLQEMEPALEDLQALGQQITPAFQDFMAAMGPALTELMEQVEDWSRYHPPEIMENGDIIIRRKPKLPDPQNEVDI
jgi:hypothetical protein